MLKTGKTAKNIKNENNFKKTGENHQNYRKNVKNFKKPGKNRQEYTKKRRKCQKTEKKHSK